MPDRFTKHTAAGAALYEAAGLRWLSAVTDGAAVVEVISADEHEIVLPRVESVRPSSEAAAEFGRRLAATHDAGAEAFGAPPEGWAGDGWIGTEPMTLAPRTSWGPFYAEQRCRPFAERAYARGGLDRDGLAVVEGVCTRIREGMYDDDAPPARIHGDLWSGNVMVTAAGCLLIDPAAHGGHRISDLAMLAPSGLRTSRSPWLRTSGRQPGCRPAGGISSASTSSTRSSYTPPSSGPATEPRR